MLTDEEKAKIEYLLKKGWSYQEIAKHLLLCLSHCIVQNTTKEIEAYIKEEHK